MFFSSAGRLWQLLVSQREKVKSRFSLPFCSNPLRVYYLYRSILRGRILTLKDKWTGKAHSTGIALNNCSWCWLMRRWCFLLRHQNKMTSQPSQVGECEDLQQQIHSGDSSTNVQLFNARQRGLDSRGATVDVIQDCHQTEAIRPVSPGHLWAQCPHTEHKRGFTPLYLRYRARASVSMPLTPPITSASRRSHLTKGHPGSWPILKKHRNR